MEGNRPAQPYVDVYKTMIYIHHWLQSEKITDQSVQGLVYPAAYVIAGRRNMFSVVTNTNAQFSASA